MTDEGDSEGLFGLRGRRLLVVEDNPLCAEAVREWLRICGATVDTAATVRDALARIRRHAPDLVVLDVLLPDGTGWDVLERMRKAPRSRGVPAVAITGAPPSTVAGPAGAHGVRHVLTKPIAPEALAAALTDCLNSA